MKFENGQLVEYWIDVPVEKPKPGEYISGFLVVLTFTAMNHH